MSGAGARGRGTNPRAPGTDSPAPPRLEESGARLTLSGTLTLATAAALFRDTTSTVGARAAAHARPAGDDVRAPGPLELDLAALGRVDSAALAVLVEWRRAARSAGAPLVYVNAPAQLRAIARACALESVLDGERSAD